jgi:hypothetical protein
MASSNSFFSYTDAAGVEVIVQRLADVPQQYRDQVKHIDLSKPAITLRSASGENTQTPHGMFLHGPSFILGAGTTLVLGMLARLAFHRAYRLLALAVGVAVMAALGIGYMTSVRRQARLLGSGLTTPITVLDDARAAAGALNERHHEQERLLDDVDKQR